MSNFLQDNFNTGTGGESIVDGTYTANIGKTYSKVGTAYGYQRLASGNGIRGSSGGSNLVINNVIPIGANYEVKLTFVYHGTATDIGCYVRCAAANTGSYFAEYQAGSNKRWALFVYNGTSSTLLGSISYALTTGTTYTVRVSAIGTQISAYYSANGGTEVQIASATNSVISATNYAGMIQYGYGITPTDTTYPTGTELIAYYNNTVQGSMLLMF